MVKMDVKLERLRDERTGRFVSRAAFRNLFHAAASIARDAKASIRRSDRPASPGQPVRTRRAMYAKRAIRFDVAADRKSAVIGPQASMVGRSMAAHEIGGLYKGQRYPQRPVMVPALERAAPRFAGSFSGSIGA